MLQITQSRFLAASAASGTLARRASPIFRTLLGRGSIFGGKRATGLYTCSHLRCIRFLSVFLLDRFRTIELHLGGRTSTHSHSVGSFREDADGCLYLAWRRCDDPEFRQRRSVGPD